MIPVTDTGINLIKSFEGLRLSPYHGAADRPDVFTIGFGTIQYPPFYQGGRRVTMQDLPITEELAISFLRYELENKAAAIDPFLVDGLTKNQFSAVLSFVYNLGEQAFRTSTLRSKINANPNDQSIRTEFMRWIHSDGKEQPGLIDRRKKEADLYFTP